MLKTIITLMIVSTINLAYATQIEVLHYWTSQGEKAALNFIKQSVDQNGDSWIDFTVTGGGGESSAYSVLQMRTIVGDPPAATLMEGPTIREWASLDFLFAPYTEQQMNFLNQNLPPILQEIHQYQGNYVAIPINIHRINWLWVNKDLFKKLDLVIPSTWQELIDTSYKIKQAGYIPIAQGGQPWQDATLFENLLLGLEGGEFYKKVFIEQEPYAINSSNMLNVLNHFRQLKQFIDDNSMGRDWSSTVELLNSGKAAMMIMGDWAKGDLIQDGEKIGKHIQCIEVPGTQNYFVYNIDSFAMLKTNNDSIIDAQKRLIALLIDPKFQIEFNRIKGSIPAFINEPLTGFDNCAIKSNQDFKQAQSLNHLLPSMAHSMAVNAQTKDVFFRTINNFFTHPKQTPEQAIKELNMALLAVKN